MHHGQVGFTGRVGQILVKREQLARRQHAFIDDNSGREAAGIELFGFGQCCVATQRVSKALADDVEHPFEMLAVQLVCGGDK